MRNMRTQSANQNTMLSEASNDTMMNTEGSNPLENCSYGQNYSVNARRSMGMQ